MKYFTVLRYEGQIEITTILERAQYVDDESKMSKSEKKNVFIILCILVCAGIVVRNARIILSYLKKKIYLSYKKYF